MSKYSSLTPDDRYFAKCTSCNWFRTRKNLDYLKALSIVHYESSGHFWISLGILDPTKSKEDQLP